MDIISITSKFKLNMTIKSELTIFEIFSVLLVKYVCNYHMPLIEQNCVYDLVALLKEAYPKLRIYCDLQ